MSTALMHSKLVFPRRVERLATILAGMLPPNATVLDLGAGDGQIGSRIMQLRSDIKITGADVHIRPDTAIPVLEFDGLTLPAESGSYDVVMLVDVVHHAADPEALLREARRVARHDILIKDHLAQGVLARPTLRLMDWVGNKRHGVRLPYNYWSPSSWTAMIEKLDLRVEKWETHLALYAPALRPFFERSLHFVGLLQLPGKKARVVPHTAVRRADTPAFAAHMRAGAARLGQRHTI